MNIAVVLSGGAGDRLGSATPKQYLLMLDTPVIIHTLNQFQNCDQIDSIFVTAAVAWME